jgi:hypothetical protein
MDVININAIHWVRNALSLITCKANPRHINGCDYSLMLQDMNQKRNSLCGMSFGFFCRKLGYVVSHKQFYFVSILIQI